MSVHVIVVCVDRPANGSSHLGMHRTKCIIKVSTAQEHASNSFFKHNTTSEMLYILSSK